MDRVSWHQYFMAQSHLLALRSTCTRLRVGATIVRDKRIIAGGYNGSVSGQAHCIDDGCYIVDNHCIRTIHAELNAILQCAKFGVQTEGAEMYVTHFPCVHCTKAIIQSGMKALYYAEDYKNDPFAIDILHKANVKVEKIALDEVLIDTKMKEKRDFVQELIQRLQKAGIDQREIQALQTESEKLFASYF